MYLIIFFSIIFGLKFLGIKFRIPINYELYVNCIIEKVEILCINIRKNVSPILINLSYNLLYGLSVCQIKINKIKNMLVPYAQKLEKCLKDYNIIFEIKTEIVKIIDKNGNIEHTLDIPSKTQIEALSNLFDETRHEGFFIYDKNYKTGYVNKIYYEKVPPKVYYEESKINFMAIELEYENKKYNIDLKNKDSNYYIVNNSLNQNFFKYYLKNVLKVAIDDNNFDYTVTIIDYNVNIITLLPNQSIIFNLQDYSILPVSESSNFNTINSTDNNNFDHESESIYSDKSDDFVKLN